VSIGIYHLFGWVPASKIPRDVDIILGQKKNVLFASRLTAVNPLMPNDPYRGRTAPLTS